MVSAVALAAASIFLVAPSASAAVTVTGGPYIGLNPAGDTVKVTLTNFPTTGGLYIQECLVTTGRPSPSMCNPASAVWVSTATGATFKPTDLISIPVLSSFAGVNCLVQGCGLFFRMDHTAPANTSEDRFMALTFTGQAMKVSDEFTVKVNGTVIGTTGTNLAYNTPTKFEITTKSGQMPALTTTGDCSYAGTTVTANKGSGSCVVTISTIGNANYAPTTITYTMTLVPGVQTINFKAPKLIVGTKLLLLGKATTNMGVKPAVTASPSNVCSLKTVGTNIMVVAKSKGTCTITLTAPAKEGFYTALSKSYTYTVKAKS